MKTITTHNGTFHTDDIFAVATLLLALKSEECVIRRTRDGALFVDSDYVVDVGGVHDSKKGRFDHHQQGGAGKRENGIPYASFGLVWATYGLELCGGNLEVFEMIDNHLVAGVDAADNGVELFTNIYKGIYPYTIGTFFSSFNLSDDAATEEIDKTFINCVNIAKDTLSREISRAINQVTLQQKTLESYQKAGDKRVIVLNGRYPWASVLQKFPEPLFVVYPDRGGDRWTAKVVPVEPMSFVARKNFPSSWAGKSDEELQKITGVADAVFCHNALFIAVAKSKEGAVQLAQMAVNA